MQPGECVLVLDFAENYSFVVQDAAKGFHWNNSKATIHPFVLYYIPTTRKVCHKSYACISNHRVHDTANVYCFLQKLLNEYVKVDFLHVHKVFYFSDGSGVQYKNFKSFTNLLLHEQDFNLKTEWHFFAISHGKNACDCVGGTIKRLATYASLQRTISNQIETPLKLVSAIF